MNLFQKNCLRHAFCHNRDWLFENKKSKRCLIKGNWLTKVKLTMFDNTNDETFNRNSSEVRNENGKQKRLHVD
jgi:hypothetical protein